MSFMSILIGRKKTKPLAAAAAAAAACSRSVRPPTLEAPDPFGRRPVTPSDREPNMAELDPELLAKMAQAVDVVMDLDPDDPFAVLLREVVEELVSRTEVPMLKQAFPILANHLPPAFVHAPIAQLLPRGYAASLGLPGMDFPFFGQFDSLSYFGMEARFPDVGDLPYAVHARYHRLARLVVLLESLPTEDAVNVSRAARLKAYILSGLQDLAIAGRHGYTMSLPHPFILWVEEEIKNLKVMEESTWMFGDSHGVNMWMIRDHREQKRIMWLIGDRRELIYDLHYGWKLHCCRQVMSDGPTNVVDEVVPMLLAATQDMNLQDAYRSLAYELPVQYVIRAVSDFLPQDYAHSLGLPAGMDQPFHRLKTVCGFTRRPHASNQACSPEHCIQTKHVVYFYHMDSKNERELYTLQAYYHRIARLIILEASLTTLSDDNGPIVARLKDGICTLLRWCAITYSLRRGDCTEIPRPIVQWVERYIEELNNKLQRVEQDIQETRATLKDASGSNLAKEEDLAKEEERKRLVEVIEDYDKMIHGTIDYM